MIIALLTVILPLVLGGGIVYYSWDKFFDIIGILEEFAKYLENATLKGSERIYFMLVFLVGFYSFYRLLELFVVRPLSSKKPWFKKGVSVERLKSKYLVSFLMCLVVLFMYSARLDFWGSADKRAFLNDLYNNSINLVFRDNKYKKGGREGLTKKQVDSVGEHIKKIKEYRGKSFKRVLLTLLERINKIRTISFSDSEIETICKKHVDNFDEDDFYSACASYVIEAEVKVKFKKCKEAKDFDVGATLYVLDFIEKNEYKPFYVYVSKELLRKDLGFVILDKIRLLGATGEMLDEWTKQVEFVGKVIDNVDIS